jgi:hypothetical protein
LLPGAVDRSAIEPQSERGGPKVVGFSVPDEAQRQLQFSHFRLKGIEKGKGTIS